MWNLHLSKETQLGNSFDHAFIVFDCKILPCMKNFSLKCNNHLFFYRLDTELAAKGFVGFTILNNTTFSYDALTMCIDGFCHCLTFQLLGLHLDIFRTACAEMGRIQSLTYT